MRITINGHPIECSHTGDTSNTVRLVGVPLCPDLLRYDLLGEADTWRGRLVRGFFWLLEKVS